MNEILTEEERLQNPPYCNGCGQPMFEIGGIGKLEQIGKLYQPSNSKYTGWCQTGEIEQKLYQCPECKYIKIK